MSKRTSLSHWSLLGWALLSATSVQTASAQAPAPASTSAQPSAPVSAGVEVDTPTTVSPQELAPRDPSEFDRTRADEQVVQLSAEQAVARALGFSPSLRVAGYEQRAASEAVRAEEGRYPYSLIGDVGFTRSESPQLRADDSVAASTSRSLDATVGLQKSFPFGGVAEVTATEQYFDSDVRDVMVSPFLPASSGHAAALRAAVSQPLMRGFGTTVGEAELRAARINENAAGKALLREQSALARDVLVAYYELWYAARALEIDQASLALAREQERQANERVEVGSLALAETLAFQTRSAELQESVIASLLGLRQRSITLAQLMGQLTIEPVRFVPSSEPDIERNVPPVSTLEAAVAADSIELAELEAQVQQAEVRARVAGDAARPRLDGNAYVQSNGISERLPNAWQRAVGLDWWSAHVGVSFELPLTGSREQALAAEAQLGVLSARAQLKAARDRILAEAKAAWETARAARERLMSAEQTLAIAERSFEAAAARFELGQTAAVSLQQAEEDLRRSRLRAARARVDIVQEQVQLEHLTGRLLQRYPFER